MRSLPHFGNLPGGKISTCTTLGLAVGLAGFLLIWHLGAYSAAAAVNDTCTTAIALTNGIAFEMDTSDATSEDQEVTTCASGTGKGVWFTFTPASSGPVTVSTVGSSFDTVLQVFTGACSGLTPLVCNDDNSIAGYLFQAGVILNATGGVTYHILATGGSAQSGLLRIMATTGAANDTCENPVPLIAGVVCTMTTTNANASGDPVPACQANFGKGVWFKYSFPFSQSLAVSTVGSDFDTVVAVYSGSCGALTPVACNDNNGPVASGSAASVTFSASAATTYYILAGGANAAGGLLSLVISAVPANDTCSGAIPLVSGVEQAVSTEGALSGGDPASACATSGGAVWFRFSPAQSGPCLITTCQSGFDTVLDVFDGTCGGLTPVACADDNGPDCAGLNASLIFSATAGHDYLIMVSGKNGQAGTVRIRAALQPSNDACLNALTLANAMPVNVDTHGALASASPVPACGPSFGRDVWFQFTPSSSAQVTVSTCGSDFDTVVQVYTGNCASLQPLACNDDYGPVCAGFQASVSFAGTAGTTYYLQAGGASRASGMLSIVAWVAGPPVLNFTKSANTLVLNWIPGDTLQRATNINSPIYWLDVGTSGSLSEPTTNPSRFFRVKR